MIRTRLQPVAVCLSACGLLALAPAASAQIQKMHYSHNWAPMHNAPTVALSGPAIFAGFTPPGDETKSTIGDAIRRCYGMDSTQGGRNQSTARYEVTWMRVAQGYAAQNLVPGVDIGMMSIQAASDSSLGGDACVAPFFPSAGNTGSHQVGAVFFPGVIQSTAGQPFPMVHEIVFDLQQDPMTPTGVTGPTVLGSGPGGDPLLVNLIFEVQGPQSGGPDNNQYYMASVNETVGRGTGAPGPNPGGVTNGILQWGEEIYGVDPVTSNAISHSRVMSTHEPIAPTTMPGGQVTSADGTMTAGPIFYDMVPGDTEFAAHVAFQSPFLWAVKDGDSGAGATDWLLSQDPVSVIDLRVLDHLSGGESTLDKFWNTSLAGMGENPAKAYDPCVFFNQTFFMYSATPATTMQQQPMSWDDLGGLIPPIAGSHILGGQNTKRENFQRIPANFDALTIFALGFGALSLGKKFTNSDDMSLDGTIADMTGVKNSLFEGMFRPFESGMSSLSAGAVPVVGQPTANPLPKFGIAAMGLQINTCTLATSITEVSSALTINPQ